MTDAIKYCAGIQIIVDQHAPLRKQMKEISDIAEQLAKAPEQFEKLNSAVNAFIQNVEPHSKAEDEVLSPLLAKYVGADAPPVAGNAAQHEEARRLLKLFQEESKAYQAGEKSRLPQAVEAILGAMKVLTEHFDTEEARLFPLAEKTLSADDKATLLANLQARGY